MILVQDHLEAVRQRVLLALELHLGRRLGPRLLATLSEGDWNILLTSSLTPESRMMIHRNVLDRLATLASRLRDS